MATPLLGKAYTAGPGGQVLRTTSANNTPTAYQSAAVQSNPAAVPSPVVSADPLIQQITGLIQNNQGASFDPVYDSALRGIQTRLAELTSGQEVSNRRMNEDYAQGKQDLSQSHEQSLGFLANKLANSGMGISGVNIAEQGRIGGLHQKAGADLDTQYSRGQEDINRYISEQRQRLSEGISGAESERSGRAAEAARLQAEEDAKAQAAIDTANANRTFMESLLAQLTAATQPVPTPTGQFTAPPALNTPIQPFIPNYFDSGNIMGGAPVENSQTAPIMGGAPQTGPNQLSNLPSYKQRQLR